jgi:hypothetical protein
MFNLSFILSGVPQKLITIEKLFDFIGDNATKRINFAGSHVFGLCVIKSRSNTTR